MTYSSRNATPGLSRDYGAILPRTGSLRGLAGVAGLAGFFWCAPGVAADEPAEIIFRDPTFEQLADVVVVSVARKDQPYFSTPAAVYVINSDDIRRSGARNIPDALRLAPGVEVARISPYRYAVGIRGFNNEFTTKLLVLQDGRSLYTPLFAGTFWDMQDTLLDDIDHIEVVRGPGGTAWGANAVNGVINIVTKRAADTQGALVDVGGGDEERWFASARYGGAGPGDSAFRVFVKGAQRDAGVFDDASDAHDGWRQIRGGFRLDGRLTSRDAFTAHGEAYDGRADQLLGAAADAVLVNGAYVLARWDRAGSNERSFSLQAYVDASRRETVQGVADRHDYSVEWLQRIPKAGSHDFTFGANLRRSHNVTRTLPGLDFMPPDRDLDYVGAFVDDAIHLLQDRLTVSAGLKFERNDFTSTETLPNVRMTWQPTERAVWWAAYSRGVRLPSIADNDSTSLFPGVVSLPNTNLPAERVDAMEGGVRMRDENRWSLDVALFVNDYDKLRTRETTIIASPPTVVRTRDAKLYGDSYGIESVVGVQLTDRWRVQLQASYLNADLMLRADSTDQSAPDEVGVSPNWQAAVRSSLRVGTAANVTVLYRYVGPLSALHVPGYNTIDVRAAWQINSQLQLILCGQNLWSPQHLEFRAAAGQPPGSIVQRGVYAQMRWQR